MRTLTALLLLLLALSAAAADTPTIEPGIAQLRYMLGTWDVVTERLAPDGSVRQRAEGSYRFEWVVPDRVLTGRSRQPQLGPSSALLFYYREGDRTVEQVSVSADGRLWVLSGPADGDVFLSPPETRPDGATIQLRFTHYNVEPDRFESRMEVTRDGGATWTPANHQVLVRRAPAAVELGWNTSGRWLDAQAQAGFEGAVLVVRDGEVVLDRAYGFANRELGLQITPETIFATGSLPIDYTHVAILQLAQAGKLALSDPITRFFDTVPADKRAITVEHLMTGASGLPDFHDVPTDRDPDHAWIDRDEALRRIFAQELLFAPGESEAHSHSAWGVLAAIVEIVSGQRYQEYTREHIFAPAGMTDTGFNGEPQPAGRLAIGYGVRADGDINAPPWWGETSWLVLGSGGQVGTTHDTGRFLDALHDGVLLEPPWAQRFFGPGVSAKRNGDAYGYEMFVYTAPLAQSYVVTLTNANKPPMDAPDDTPFARVSQRLGDLLLEPYLPKYRLGLGLDRGPTGAAVVGSLIPDGAAARGGLREGDVLISAGGVAFGDDPLALLQPYLESGEPMLLVVRRDGEMLELTVRPAPR